MEVKLSELKDVIKKILVAYGATSNLNIIAISSATENNTIYFDLYNGESFISFKLPQESVSTELVAVVDTKAFTDLVSSLTTETVDLNVKDNLLKISSGKSSYKLPMIYDGGDLWKPTFMIANSDQPAIDISADILKSIDLINTQELSRVKEDRVKNGAGKLYYLSNNGCFTSANAYGACLNSFTLDGTFELLLNKTLVKLFKLFPEGLSLSYEESVVNNRQQIKISLMDSTTLVTVLAPADKTIRATMLKMVYRLKEYASAIYQTHLVINSKELKTVLSRLNIAAKHSGKAKEDYNKLSLVVDGLNLTITDEFENSESLDLAENSVVVAKQTIRVFLEDIKPVADLCEADFIEIDTNSTGVMIISFNNIKYFLTQLAPEN